ncbi:hypothetical protein BJ875DRAFT_520372 [Amylocarpus encephaloides]|uniref:Uncharacterized protein n=1 Tax=Amylocarpus encephaloides TaxID=45428 RepID=A0A9P8C1G0_9HELO|nr:hypothetical protein BJ875DRAFT_520372 [Amylocarpus encephaloides]
MMPTEWDDAILRAREHSHSGRFNDALRPLRSELELGGSVLRKAHLASEVADILRIQGFLRKAYSTASEALRWRIPDDAEIGKLLIVQEAYLGVLALGCYGDALERVESVYESTLRNLKLEEYTSPLIRIEAYRAKFLEIATLDRQYDLDLASTEMIDRLSSLLEHLIKTNSVEDAWVITCQLDSSLRRKEFGIQPIIDRNFQRGLLPPESSILGREVLRRSIEWLQEHNDLPIYLRSIIRYEQARSLQALGKKDESEHMFKLARNDFDSISHPYGSLEIELSLLLPDLASRDNQLDWPQLRATLNNFKIMAPPIKLYMWLQSTRARADTLFINQLPWIMDEMETCVKCLESDWFHVDEQYSQALISHRGGKNGEAVRTLTNILQVVQPWSVPYRNGIVAQTLSRACKTMKNYEQAKTWAMYCIQQWNSCRSSDIQSAKEELALLDLIMTPPTLKEDVEIMNHQIAADISQGLFSTAIDKCVALGKRILNSSLLSIRQSQSFIRESQSSFQESQLSIPERWEMAQGMMKQAFTMLGNLEEKNQLLQLTNISDVICTCLGQRAECNSSVELYNCSIVLQQNLRTKHLVRQDMFQAAMAQLRIALVYQDIHRLLHKRHSNGENLEAERLTSLHGALAAFQGARTGFFDVGDQSMVAFTAFQIGSVQFQLWNMDKASFDNVHQSLVAAQRLADERRNDLSALRTLDAIQTKQAMAEEQHVKRIHQFGFWASLRSGLLELQWFWMQNGKARSVSDILGLGTIIPERLIKSLRED